MRQALTISFAALLFLFGGEGQGAEGEPLEVTVATSMTYPGVEAVYPVYLKGKPDGALRSLSLELRFPANLVKFARLEKGFLLEDRGVAVENEVSQAGGDAEQTMLAVKLVMPEGHAGGIPEGLLLYLAFQIDPSAPLGAEIPLKNRAKAAAAVDGKPVEVPVNFPDQVIPLSPRKQEDEPALACFFYMH